MHLRGLRRQTNLDLHKDNGWRLLGQVRNVCLVFPLDTWTRESRKLEISGSGNPLVVKTED